MFLLNQNSHEVPIDGIQGIRILTRCLIQITQMWKHCLRYLMHND